MRHRTKVAADNSGQTADKQWQTEAAAADDRQQRQHQIRKKVRKCESSGSKQQEEVLKQESVEECHERHKEQSAKSRDEMEASGGRRWCSKKDWKKAKKKGPKRQTETSKRGRTSAQATQETGSGVTFGLNNTRSSNSTVPEAVVVKRCQWSHQGRERSGTAVVLSGWQPRK
jgi:hypothetical protein